MNNLTHNNHDSAVTIADIAKSSIKLQKSVDRYLAQLLGNPSSEITIAKKELLLITGAIQGCTYSWGNLRCLGSDVLEEAAHNLGYPEFGIDAGILAAKLSVAPIGVLQAVIADVQEALKHHKGGHFVPFLESRNYSFRPLTGAKLGTEHPCVVAASLADGSIVSDRISSHVRPEAVTPVTRALAKVSPRGRSFIQEEVKFPGIVGTTACVSTSCGDEIVLAQRLGRLGLTRFVKGREPEPCDSVFVVLKRIRPRRYLVITGFVGHRPEPEPWDERAFSFAKDPAAARERSRKFWTEHALVYDPDVIVPGTEHTEL